MRTGRGAAEGLITVDEQEEDEEFLARRPLTADAIHGAVLAGEVAMSFPVDMLIERPDLGPGCSTLLVAGEPIPAALAGNQRRERT